jgi:chitinase
MRCVYTMFLCFLLVISNVISASVEPNGAPTNSSYQSSKKDKKKASGDLKKAKGDVGKFKKDLKKIEKKLSFLNFFHHSDSAKLSRQYIHQHHQLTKGKKTYPYKVDHDKLGLKVEAFNDTTEFKLDYDVFGFYPYWEGDLHKSLNYSLLTTIAYFSYEVDVTTGNPKTTHDWETTPVIDSAHANGTKVLLTVTNFGQTNNKAFLTNNNAINTLITQLKSLLEKRNGNGVCLDFEGVANAQKADYAKFITLLSQELKKANKEYLVYITVPGVDWAKSMDFETLIPAVDRFLIMGYGYYGSTSKVAGPVDLLNSGKIWEPYNLTTSVDYYLANQVPSSKLTLVLPYYGSIWETETANKGSKVASFIGNRTYDYIKSKIVAPIQYDSLSQSAWCSYVVAGKGENKFRQCWFDNDSTLGVKLNFIKEKKIAGMGIWALGYDKGYTDLWQVIATNFCNTTVLPEDGISTSTTIDSLSVDSTKSNSSMVQFWDKLTNIEGLLREVTNYKTVLLFTMSFIVLFGGTGFVIAMFQPNTRMFFFCNTAYTVYYSAFVLLFLLVILRWVNVINNLSIALILGFITGGVAIYFITKIVEQINNNKP